MMWGDGARLRDCVLAAAETNAETDGPGSRARAVCQRGTSERAAAMIASNSRSETARRLGDNLFGSAAVKPRDDLVGNVVLRTDLPQYGAERLQLLDCCLDADGLAAFKQVSVEVAYGQLRRVAGGQTIRFKQVYNTRAEADARRDELNAARYTIGTSALIPPASDSPPWPPWGVPPTSCSRNASVTASPASRDSR